MGNTGRPQRASPSGVLPFVRTVNSKRRIYLSSLSSFDSLALAQDDTDS